MFHRQRKPAAAVTAKTLKNLTKMQKPATLLAEEKRLKLVKQIRELTALEDSRYESCCAVLLANLVNYCQLLPETANSYYSQPGGVVDFALNRTEAALSLFKEFMVVGPDETLSDEQRLWQYALLSAGLLQGIGKLFVDYEVNLLDSNNQVLKQWNPLLESLTNTGTQYAYEFEKEGDVDFRRRLNLLLAKALMPQSGFDWIASDEQVLAVWLALLHEDLRSAGTLGALLIRANAIAIHRYILEFMGKGHGQRTLPYGRAGTFSGGTPESITDKELAIGVEVLNWLNKSLEEGKIMINKAPLYMVPGGMLMSREMFNMFMRDHPGYTSLQAVQNGFMALGLHAVGPDGNPETRFEQSSNQQMHSGIVFSEFAVSLPDKVQVHNIATGKVETMSALELINKAQYPSQFTQQQNALAVDALQRLNAAGKWQAIEALGNQNALGVNPRG